MEQTVAENPAENPVTVVENTVQNFYIGDSGSSDEDQEPVPAGPPPERRTKPPLPPGPPPGWVPPALNRPPLEATDAAVAAAAAQEAAVAAAAAEAALQACEDEAMAYQKAFPAADGAGGDATAGASPAAEAAAAQATAAAASGFADTDMWGADNFKALDLWIHSKFHPGLSDINILKVAEGLVADPPTLPIIEQQGLMTRGPDQDLSKTKFTRLFTLPWFNC